MSLLDSIERLQQAPVHKRKIVLALSVSIIMAIIISLWVMQLQYTLSTSTDHGTSIAEPIKLLWDSAKADIKSFYEKRQ